MFRLLARAILWVPFRLIFWTRVENMRELKKLRGRPVIIVCNHRSNMDGVTLFFAMPRRMHIMAKDSLFKRRLLSWVFRKILMFPVDRANPIAGTKHSLKLLKSGECLLMFPEGTRNTTSEDALALKNGASMLAIKTGVPILPIIINRKPKPFALTRVRVGEVIHAEGFAKEELTNKVASAMYDLLGTWDKQPLTTARAIVIRGDEILLMRRNRGGEDYFTTPGGHIDEGEQPRAAAGREVLEETGITVKPRRLIYKRIRPDDRTDNCMESYWACEYVGGEITKNPESEEYQPGAETRTWRDGRPAGTYNPEWVSLGDLATIDLKPETMKNQLLKDLRIYGTRLSRPTKFLRD